MITHTTLAAGFKGLTGDPAKILQGDFFLQAGDSRHHGFKGLPGPRGDHHLVGRIRVGRCPRRHPGRPDPHHW